MSVIGRLSGPTASSTSTMAPPTVSPFRERTTPTSAPAPRSPHESAKSVSHRGTARSTSSCSPDSATIVLQPGVTPRESSRGWLKVRRCIPGCTSCNSKRPDRSETVRTDLPAILTSAPGKTPPETLSKTIPLTVAGTMSGVHEKPAPSTSSTRFPTSWIDDRPPRRIAPGVPTRPLCMGAWMNQSRTIQRPSATSANRTSPRARVAPAMRSPV